MKLYMSLGPREVKIIENYFANFISKFIYSGLGAFFTLRSYISLQQKYNRILLDNAEKLKSQQI